MKTFCLALLLCVAPGGDRERGLQLYREGKFAEAAAAFRAAIEHDGDSPELQWNLALASWRAGELPAAEDAAEKYAALGRDARTDLHAGLLGAIRHDEAKLLEAKADAAGGGAPPAPGTQPEDPLPLLEQALTKATQARDHFVRAASASASPELLRNTERSLRTIDELQKKIDELKKQREQQKKDEDKKNDEKKKQDDKKDDKKDEPKKNDENKDGDKKPQDDEKDPSKDEKKGQKSDQKQDGKPDEQSKPDDASKQDPQQQPGKNERPEPKPEPKPNESEAKDQKPDQKPEPKADKDEKPEAGDKHEPQETKGDKPEPKPEPRHDAPGEGGKGKELTPEQAQRLLEQLRDLDDKLKAIRVRAKSARPPVERDW